jgi:lysophospholipase L1-like esterase
MGRIATVLTLVVLVCAPAATAQTAVFPLGDSITWGASLVAVPTPGGYRGLLDDQLTHDGIAHTFVGTSEANPPMDGLLRPADFRHDGIPGARVDEVDAALAGPSPYDGGYWLTSGGVRPDVAIVMLGTNDIIQGYDPKHGQGAAFVADLVGRLNHLLANLRAHAPGVRIVLCTIVPMDDPVAAAYNDAIRTGLVPRLRAGGVRVALADVEHAFLAHPQEQLVSMDGRHPLPAGYQAMESVIAPAVEQLVRKPHRHHA